MKKTARVIITSKCDRKCPGCCNSKLDYTSLAKVIGGITALKDYEEVVITGGEPMIIRHSSTQSLKCSESRIRDRKSIFIRLV